MIGFGKLFIAQAQRYSLYPFIALSQRSGPSKTRGWENDASFENKSSNLNLKSLKLSTII